MRLSRALLIISISLILMTSAACNRPEDAAQTDRDYRPYERVWTWNLDIASIDIKLQPYPSLTSPPTIPDDSLTTKMSIFDASRGDEAEKNIILTLRDQLQRRFINQGFLGFLRIRLPHLAIERARSETELVYRLGATIHFRLERLDDQAEQLWPLEAHESFPLTTVLSLDEEKELFDRLLDRLTRQLQDASGEKIYPILEPYRLKQ